MTPEQEPVLGQQVTDAASGATYRFTGGSWMQVSVCCPVCKMVSWNPNDIYFGFCGSCHDYTSDRGTMTPSRSRRGEPGGHTSP